MKRKRAEDTWTTHDLGLLHSPSFTFQSSIYSNPAIIALLDGRIFIWKSAVLAAAAKVTQTQAHSPSRRQIYHTVKFRTRCFRKPA